MRAARAWRVLLFFQEQISGPENASIARFDGLGCYQTSSEMGGVLQGVAGMKKASAFEQGAGLRPGAAGQSALHDFHGAVVVAVVAVRVVQAAIDEKVDVVAVRHGFVAAAGAVHVARFVA